MININLTYKGSKKSSVKIIDSFLNKNKNILEKASISKNQIKQTIKDKAIRDYLKNSIQRKEGSLNSQDLNRKVNNFIQNNLNSIQQKQAFIREHQKSIYNINRLKKVTESTLLQNKAINEDASFNKILNQLTKQGIRSLEKRLFKTALATLNDIKVEKVANEFYTGLKDNLYNLIDKRTGRIVGMFAYRDPKSQNNEISQKYFIGEGVKAQKIVPLKFKENAKIVNLTKTKKDSPELSNLLFLQSVDKKTQKLLNNQFEKLRKEAKL